MSTEQLASAKRGFKAPEPSVLPTQANLGRVGNVEKARLSKSENYVVVPFEIHGNGSAKNTKVWLTFHPNWLSFDFDPKDLENKEGFPDLVYGSNVVASSGLAVLQGIAGSEESFMDLCEALSKVVFDIQDTDEEKVAEQKKNVYLKELTATFKKYFETVKPTIGYVLSQKSEKVGEDSEGKGIYKRTKFYETSFFWPSEEKLEQLREKAEKSKKAIESAKEKAAEIRARNKELPADQQEAMPKIPKMFQVTFDDDVAF